MSTKTPSSASCTMIISMTFSKGLKKIKQYTQINGRNIFYKSVIFNAQYLEDENCEIIPIPKTPSASSLNYRCPLNILNRFITKCYWKIRYSIHSFFWKLKYDPNWKHAHTKNSAKTVSEFIKLNNVIKQWSLARHHKFTWD